MKHHKKEDDSWLATNGPDEMPNEDPPEWGWNEALAIHRFQEELDHPS